jgi:azurin
VTFPAGASVEWVDVEQGGALRPDKVAFRAFNTPANLDRIAAIELDPVKHAPACAALEYRIWKFKPDEMVPPLLASEKVLTSAERLMPRPAAAEFFNAQLMPEGAHYYASVLDSWKSPSMSVALQTLSKLRVHYSREGDRMLLYGLSATPRGGGGGANMEDADMEFSLTLTEGQEAVLHLGHKRDGADWVLGIQAHLVPFLADKPVQNLTLGVKPALMQFDTPVVTAKAGAPVRLTYRNETCLLPHNFVLVKPGALDAIGKQVDRMLRNEQESRNRSYIPSGSEIIATSSSLLMKGQSEVIYFTAPAAPGDYPYVCTFPGHWRLQQGVLRVVP